MSGRTAIRMFDGEAFARALELYANGRSLREMARVTGVSFNSLGRALRQEQTPCLDVFMRLCVLMQTEMGLFVKDTW